jgi:hypothetical protein
LGLLEKYFSKYNKNVCFNFLLVQLQMPPIQWVPEDLSMEVKQLDHEADHPPPSSAKAKNSWSYTSIPH